MNKDIKAEWVKRLREPDRKQTIGNLHTEQGQCCLGVLAEYAAECGIVTVSNHSDGTLSYDGNESTLPGKAVGWSGLNNDIGTFSDRFVGSPRVQCLAQANDAGMSFGEIADIIEKEF